MSERPARRFGTLRLVGRGMVGSALVMLALAALFFSGVLGGGDERTRVLIAMILGFTAAIDALAGLLLLAREAS